MIFNCPRCSAGHSVPVSMIPNGGLEMSCRRCNELFHVSLAEKTNANAVPAPAKGEFVLTPGEATKIGVANPLEDDEVPLRAPDGRAFSADGKLLVEETTDDADREETTDDADHGSE